MADVLILRSRLRPVGSSQVRRLLPAAKKQAVGPFLFFDHFGPEEPGAINWMTAGRGIAHSERAPEELRG